MDVAASLESAFSLLSASEARTRTWGPGSAEAKRCSAGPLRAFSRGHGDGRGEEVAETARSQLDSLLRKSHLMLQKSRTTQGIDDGRMESLARRSASGFLRDQLFHGDCDTGVQTCSCWRDIRARFRCGTTRNHSFRQNGECIDKTRNSHHLPAIPRLRCPTSLRYPSGKKRYKYFSESFGSDASRQILCVSLPGSRIKVQVREVHVHVYGAIRHVLKGCERHCSPTLGYNVAYCHSAARVMPWLLKQAHNGFQGATSGFE